MRALALAAALLFATPALAYDDPKAMLEAFYAPYFSGTMDFAAHDALESLGLKALYEADSKDANGEVGRIDFDPFIQGQDWDTTAVTIGKIDILGGTARAEVDFTNFRPVHLVYTLVLERDGWKVDDVYWPAEGEYDAMSLRQLLTSPFP